MRLLTDKVAIITGASSGIGRAAAALFTSQGARVVLVARRKAELKTLVDEIAAAGGQAIAYAGDVSDLHCAEVTAALAVDRFGRLDIAFNNAGTLGAMGETPQIELEDWNQTLATNLTSAFLAAKFQIPAMLNGGGGSLIFTASFVGQTVGFPGMAAYAASKAGLIGLTQALAAEFGPRGIRVNALLPGGTDTPMGRTYADSPETLSYVQSLHALKRIAEPDEIAQAALYLASDMASFMTGSAMLVDGGVSISRA